MSFKFQDKRVAILNSRQNLRPCGDDLWIKQSGRAVKRAVENGNTILTSVGMNSWEVVLYFVSKYNAPVVVYIPAEEGIDLETTKQSILRQFCLKNELTDWRVVEFGADKKDRHYFQHRRDELIINDADVVYPITARPDGNMMRLLNKLPGEKVENNFKIEYVGETRKYKIEIDRNRINPEINQMLDRYLIHWTRSSNTNWPGETKYEYYEAVVQSNSVYPRDALATLKRILRDKKIIASSRHYRKNMAAVAFSSLPPSEAIKLMKWRARYREMSFEPYGAAIERNFAESIGIRKVLYGPAGQYYRLDDKDKAYFQSVGTKGFWLPEKEYRYLGDLDLDKIPKKYLAAVIQSPDKIGEVQKIFDGRVVSLLSSL
jgi:hypothetical protein